jgi:hypothetical protein
MQIEKGNESYKEENMVGLLSVAAAAAADDNINNKNTNKCLMRCCGTSDSISPSHSLKF